MKRKRHRLKLELKKGDGGSYLGVSMGSGILVSFKEMEIDHNLMVRMALEGAWLQEMRTGGSRTSRTSRCGSLKGKLLYLSIKKYQSCTGFFGERCTTNG